MNVLSLEYRYDVSKKARSVAEARAALQEMYAECGCVRVLIHVQGAWSGVNAPPWIDTDTGGDRVSDAELSELLRREPFETIIIVPVCVLVTFE